MWRTEAKVFSPVPVLAKAEAGAITTVVLRLLEFSAKEEGKRRQQMMGKFMKEGTIKFSSCKE